MTNPPRYKIENITDFLEVPADRRADMLKDFALWMEVADRTRQLVPFIRLGPFVWIDDGELGVYEINVTLTKSEKDD